MGFREDLARKIDRKRAEINELASQLRTAQTYLQALEDAYKLAVKDSPVASTTPPDRDTTSPPSFRVGSMTGEAYKAIKLAGKPMHVNSLLPAIGRPVTREHRSAISGTLAAYVRKGEVFTRTAPNTFGLIEFGEQEETADPVTPPLGFGKF